MNFSQFALKNVPIPSVPKILKSHESMFLALSFLQLEECRPALEKDPPLERDTDLEGDPPGQKYPLWTEIPPWTETPPGQTDTHF